MAILLLFNCVTGAEEGNRGHGGVMNRPLSIVLVKVAHFYYATSAQSFFQIMLKIMIAFENYATFRKVG